MEYRKSFRIMLVVALSILAVTLGMNYVIDPYDVNQAFDLGMRKDIISYRGNYRLYKMQAFKNNPCPNIYLGDSRMDGLKVAKVEAASGERWFNFAYGGGTAYEIVDTFWYAAKQEHLKKVVIGINFNLYNGSNRFNLTQEAMTTLGNPLKYYFSYTTLRMSAANLLYKCAGINLYAEKPPMDKTAFWQVQLGKSTEGFYRNWYHPDDLQQELENISDYCRDQGIELVFVFPPTHVDLQERVADFGLTEDYRNYKQEIRQLGWKVYDFDVPSALTQDAELYKDPYHADELVKDKVIETIWSPQVNQSKSP